MMDEPQCIKVGKIQEKETPLDQPNIEKGRRYKKSMLQFLR
jgi:hypothetical protein